MTAETSVGPAFAQTLRMSYRMPLAVVVIALSFLGCGTKNLAQSRRDADFSGGRSAVFSSKALWQVTFCQQAADCGESRPGSQWRCINSSCLVVPASAADESAPSALATHETEEIDPTILTPAAPAEPTPDSDDAAAPTHPEPTAPPEEPENPYPYSDAP